MDGKCTVCEINRVNLWLTMLVAVFILAISFIVKGEEKKYTAMEVGESYNGSMWACATEASAVDVAVKEIADGMDEAMKVFVAKEDCMATVFFGYKPLRVVATTKNATTTTYVLEIDVGSGLKVYALSKAELVPKKGRQV